MSILKVDQIQDTAGKKILQNTGGVLQVVEGTRTDGTNTASSSYVDAGLSATITPTSSSSKVLVVVATRIWQHLIQQKQQRQNCKRLN